MKSVHVAVAVIKNDNGDVLIAKRPDHLHMGGFWEFPGGKVEAGETVLQALQREIREEVALDIHAAQPLLRIPFQYPDKHVLLDVWCVTGFAGGVGMDIPQGTPDSQPMARHRGHLRNPRCLRAADDRARRDEQRLPDHSWRYFLLCCG